MILDSHNTQKMATNAAPNGQHAEQDVQPPSYDSAMRDVTASGPYVPAPESKATDVKVPPQSVGTPSPGPAPHTPAMPTTVYNYVNPVTQERVVSLLPPDHPQMVCLQQGGHVAHTRFGLLGILAAIFWFPLGIGCCLLDRRVYCDRCGVILDEGICG